MSQENVEVVRRIFRAWEQGDFSSAEWADPGIQFHLRAGPDEAVHHGVEAMGHAWREWLSAWEDFETEACEFIDLGMRSCPLRVSGSGKDERHVH